MGFEPTRGDPIGLAGRRLNHSAKVSLPMFVSFFVVLWFRSLGSGWIFLFAVARYLRHRICVCSRVHSSVVRAADCRSAGPWFKSGCALLLVIGWSVKAGGGRVCIYPATRNRTRDHLIAAGVYSQMLYQLSYRRCCFCPAPLAVVIARVFSRRCEGRSAEHGHTGD